MDAVYNDYGRILIASGCIALFVFIAREAPSQTFPTVGVGSFPFATQIAALRSITQSHVWISEGYHKHKAAIFRVRLLSDWRYVLTGSKLFDELRRAPEEVFSFRGAANQTLQTDYMPGGWATASRVDLVLIPTKLNRKLETIIPTAIEEIGAAFEDGITSGLDGDGWTAMTVGEEIMRTVSRTNNRMIVGLPLCRNREFIDLCVHYGVDVFVSATILRNVPALLKPIVGRYMVPVTRTYARAERLMSDFIADRMRRNAERVEELPDDYLQWVIDSGDPWSLESVTSIINHILRLNLASTHTTAATSTFALYQLAAHPDLYQQPIRNEVDAVLNEHGWTKAGMDRLCMLDSFLREVLRFHGLGALTLERKAMRDYTFANGMVIKKGELVSTPSRAAHRDPAIYAHADTFDGFRFYEPESSGSEPRAAKRMTSLSAEFLAFGAGRHACPGRFWADYEMKAMIAYMLTHYELRMEQEGVVPREQWMGAVLIPDRSARVLIRKRQTPPK